MARIQTLRSSLLVLRARKSSGCARPRRDLDRAVEPPPTVLDPRQGALHLGRPSGVRLDDQARPGDDVTSLVERDRLASVRPWARQSEESSWYSPAVTGAGLQTEVSVGCLRVDQCLEHPDLAAKSLRLRRRPTSRCVQPFWARQAASRASSPSGTQPARTWAVASHRLRTLPSVRTRHRGSRLEAPRSSAPRCPAHSEQVGAEVPQPWL